MPDEQAQLERLAALLELDPARLSRHLIRPLSPPWTQPLPDWNVPALCARILEVTDGFWLFGEQAWNGFHFWGRANYAELREGGGGIVEQARARDLYPFFGEIPHLVSVYLASGAVVATDWEVYDQPEQGWGRVIAPDLPSYVNTLIDVREAHGGEHPAEWWQPYATYGDRYDLEN